MTTTKRPPGRPPLPPEQRLTGGQIRLTPAQWAKLASLGGVDWIRKKIEDARVITIRP
jgi:hypothetical protein